MVLNSYNDSIYTRRSIRKYLDKKVEIEKIEQVIDAGRMAPSAKNRQPWKYIIFGGENKKELLHYMEKGLWREANEISFLQHSRQGLPDAMNTLEIMKKAPIIVVVINDNGKSPFDEINADDRFTEICDNLSIGASIQNILLKAEELGLGTLWIANTCFAYKELTAYLDTTKQLIGAIALGYANEKPSQRPRKNINDIVEYRL